MKIFEKSPKSIQNIRKLIFIHLKLKTICNEVLKSRFAEKFKIFIFFHFLSFFSYFFDVFSWFFSMKNKKNLKKMIFSCLYFIWKTNLLHHKILASIGSPGGTTLKVYRRAQIYIFWSRKSILRKNYALVFNDYNFSQKY